MNTLFINKLFGKKEIPQEQERRVQANNRSFNSLFKYASNYIKTSKYSFLSFVPKNLFEQFQRLANFYFLVLLILQCIPVISSLQPWTTIIPLFFVLMVTAVKDAYDDLQRHLSDNQVNNRKSFVVRSGNLIEERWRNISVGDVIRMECDHFVAADLLILSTSEPYGLCYIETCELDGETNLKPRQALEETFEMGADLTKISNFNGQVICEAPNNRLNVFEGQLIWGNKKFSLNNDNVLLRGCVLRNTKWCFGLVIFAGRDTKLMMNSGKTKFKRTSLDRFLNVLIIGIVIFLMSICVICTLLCGIWENVYGVNFRVYLPWAYIVPEWNAVAISVSIIAFLVFFSYAILMNTVVPISLYVSVEIIRFYQSCWINWDTQMYDKSSDTAARARTTTLNEELGQIQYIFSDKTGTLTRNIMVFNKCIIAGNLYGEVLDDRMNPIDPTLLKPVDFSWNRWADPNFKWHDQMLIRDLERTDQENAMRTFWRSLALCHTVMPEVKDDSRLIYQAQSPDEGALTLAARNMGFVFKARTPSSITIEVDGVEEVYELLCILDFNNVRKRMSVLLRHNNRLMLFCKGADTVIFQMLKQDAATEQQVADTQICLDKLANEGLRTLCVAYKAVSTEFYKEWSVRQKEASLAVANRQARLDAVYEEIESDLTLLGATAIEDKLQEGVPETIAKLADANIKIWVLTGDKQETAINIGYSCRLLNEDMKDIFVVDGKSYEEVQLKLQEAKRQIANPAAASSMASPCRDRDPATRQCGDARLSPKVKFDIADSTSAGGPDSDMQPAHVGVETIDSTEGYALVITGHSLTHALDTRLEALFLEVGCECRAVICCRVTPLQKAQVVDLVKRKKKAVTLAIGDGANDVSMIKTAHIGVGISGQEGVQAVLSSDYSIAQFRFLERLLLVHGRWSYYRMCKFLRYFFYKNFAFTLGHFWFSFLCAYSAQTVYDPLFIACYNLCFTALPVLTLGIFDQDVSDEMSLRYPRLYIPGQYNLYFNMRIFVYSVLHGVFSSLALFFVPYAVMQENTLAGGRTLDGLSSLGFTICSCLVVTVTGQIALDTAYWTFANHFVIWGSLLFYFLVAFAFYELLPFPYLMQSGYGISLAAMSTTDYWLCMLLVAVTLILPMAGLRFLWFVTRPTLSDRVRVKQNLRRLQARLTEMPLRKPRVPSMRRRRGSTRSGYAFSHQQGFGDLITRGIVVQRLAPIKENVVEI